MSDSRMTDHQISRQAASRRSAAQSANHLKIKQMAEANLFENWELDARKIIHPGMHNKEALNAFRELRTQLVQKTKKKNFVLLVSSICQGGGGSFVSINLGAAIALDQTKTALVIDCNLYEPTVSELLTVTPDYGLTDYLQDPTVGIEDIIYASGIQRLRIIPVGTFTEGGAEHFSSDKMHAFIQSLKERYPDRFIIIDAPPVTTAVESRIISELSDMALLVVPYGKVTASQIQSGIASVGEEKLAGLVYNN